ncbi:unnamed protein product [Calicophoron daubneyi]|uniref:E3 SUMO-protein ligase RanBP2 n=1 Tax=Calicophoron daubneyi TaxID=300641 RepID=A0AAV2TS95_CALDB
MASKGQVDLRVSRMLSRCSNVSERKKLGLEIAKMYFGIGEFKIAKSFVEQFLQLEDKSTPGLLCLGRIKEATGDAIGALRIYQRLVGTSSCEKDLVIHACEMAAEVDIPADELEFWSNVACKKLPEGRIANVLKLRSKNNPDLLCNEKIHLLYVLSSMMLLRLSASTSCVSDMHSYLERLMLLLRRFVSSDEELCYISKEASVWVYFYTGVLAQRCLAEVKNEPENIAIIRQFYLRAANPSTLHRYSELGQLSSLVWEKLHLYKMEHRIQALFLSKRLAPSDAQQNFPHITSASWRELVNLLCTKSNLKKASVETSEIVSPEPCSRTLNAHQDLWEQSVDTIVLSPGNLNLLLWLCGQQLDSFDADINDSLLSDNNLKWIFQVVSVLFKNVDLANLPIPFDTTGTMVGEFCRLDAVCFLIASFLYLMIRGNASKYSLGANTENPSDNVVEWPDLPLCLLPHKLLPCSAQRRWWRAATDFLSREREASTQDAQQTFLRCGVGQLRLTSRPARCSGNQTGVLATPLVFRIAWGLSRFSKNYASPQQKRVVEDWAGGYWKAGLQFQLVGIPPAHFLQAYSRNQSLPSCSGSSTAFCETLDRSSPFSPVQSVTPKDARGQVATHLLFNLPSGYSWWMGVRRHCLTNEALEWQWCNMGMTNLLSRLKQRYEEQSHRLSNEQKQELCFLTQLLDLDSENISPDVYALGGELLMDMSNRDRDVNVIPNICENPVKDSERARHYLDKGADKIGIKKNTLAGLTDCKSEGNWFLPDDTNESTPLRNRMVSTVPKSSTAGFYPKGPSFSAANVSTCGCNHLGSDAPQTQSFVPHLPVTHPLTTPASPCNTPAVQPSVPLGEGCLDAQITERINTQFNSLTESQDLLMSGFINSWHALVNGLSSQLAETKSELSRSRQLNEQLSRQLDETNKQLLDAIGKFTEVHQKSSKSYSDDGANRTSESTRLLETSIRELINLICELRRWLPEGMAAAATAAVNAHFALGALPPSRPGPFISTAEAAALMQLYGAGTPMPQAQFSNLNQFQTQPVSHSYAAALQEPTSMPTTDPRMSKSLGGFANSVGAFVGNQLNSGHAAHVDRPLDSSAGLSGSSSAVQDASSSASTWKNGAFVNTLAQPFTDPRFSGPRPLQAVGTFGSSQSIPPPNYTGLFPSRGPLTIAATPVAIPNTLLGTPFPPSSLITSPRDVGVPSTSYEKPKPLPQSNLFRPPVTSVRSNTTSPEVISSAEQDKIKKQSGNHAVAPELKLAFPEKNEQMAIWAVRDVAEPSQGKDETFMIQLKSPDLLERFVKAVSECNSQGTPSDKPTASPEVTKSPTPIRTETSTAGKTEDLRKAFAPKPGEWTCSGCYVVNPPSAQACLACETPASGGHEKKTPPKNTGADSFASKFAPQPGSWDCPTCMLHLAKEIEVCPACHTQKPGLLPAPSTTAAKSTVPAPLFGGFTMSSGGFVFGQAKITTATSSTQSTPTKPLFSFVASSGKPASTVVTPATPTTFSFGLKATSDTPKFKLDEKPAPTSLFSSGKVLSSTSASATPEHKTESADKANSAFSALNLTEGLSKPGFTFTFGQPANVTPNLQAVSSPTKSGDEQDSDRVEPVDEDHLKFKPALEVMPEKVTVHTGEENEEVIFCERAKLYRWDSKDWRERGVGEMKLLRAQSGSVRCLMRRDHILKVCCNHPITTDMHLKPMSATDTRRWTWWAIDFTELAPEEELDKSQEAGTEISGGRRETFAVRFKTTEQAAEFKKAFDAAVKEAEKRAGRPATEKEKVEPLVKNVDLDQESASSDEVIIVEKPPQVNEDQLARARRLKLPDQFYEYENGCVSGEREPLTSAEEAEEDALLDAAIRRGNTQTLENDADSSVSVSGDVKTNRPASQEAETAVGTAKPSEQNQNNIGLPLTTSGNLSTTYIPQAQGLTDFSSLSAAVSKDTRPSWTIPSSGSSNSPNIWAAAGTQLFTKSQPTLDGHSENSANKVDDSDEVDPHYDPIVPLPELVQTKSGEEDELCLFLQRCRVYRFVDNAWKERGVGDMKVLVLPESIPAGAKTGSREVVKPEVNLGKVRRARLLMRRDQVLKICVNQPIGVDLPTFKPMGSGGKSDSMCWVGDDYSEGTASHELLSIRFKKESDAEEFKAAVKRAQSCLEKSSSS